MTDTHDDKPSDAQIQAFRKENFIHAHVGEIPDAGLEAWAIQSNRVLNYLCDLGTRSAGGLIGEQIARDTARELDNVAALIMTGLNLAEKEARIVTSGARMIERLAMRSASALTSEREAKLRDFVLGIADGFLACQSAVTPETAKAMREEGERIYKFVAALSPVNPADRNIDRG